MMRTDKRRDVVDGLFLIRRQNEFTHVSVRVEPGFFCRETLIERRRGNLSVPVS